MFMTNKLLPVALIAALIGGSLGALVMHKNQSAAPESATQDNTKYAGASTEQKAADQETVPAEFNTPTEQTAYKTGFADGFDAAARNTRANVTTRNATRPTRVVYRNTARSTPGRVYYDYNRSTGRSFWSKHRDKLTLAMGTAGGAMIGGLIGGKKGAGIGALSGAGGSALYTYKLRKRNRNY